MRLYRRLLLIVTLALLPISSLTCGTGDQARPPRNALVVTVMANTSLLHWLDDAVAEFNDTKVETSDGKRVFVVLTPTEAGQATAAIANGDEAPTVWIPDGEVWAALLAERGETAYQDDCVSVAQSPLVIAMWRPIAEALGWPGRSLGWLDIGSLAADPSAWSYYSGGQFGESLRLGHTHPGLSATGTSTLLAIVQAAQSQQEAVSAASIQQPIVQASVSAFEGAVSWFSSSTDDLGQTMRERGIGYLGAAVVYESTVLHYGEGDPEIVSIYPFEGTFVATHPACLRDDLDDGTQEAADAFRDYLLSTDAQQQAVAAGLRPSEAAHAENETPDADAAGESRQPEIVFGAPSVKAVYAVQELWQSARRDVNLVMLIDTSGSMQGRKIENVKSAAVEFVRQMGDDDRISLITFSSRPTVLAEHQQIGQTRDKIVSILDSLQASGDTALYDAIGQGASLIEETTSPETSNAIIVLTDGLDTGSREYRYGRQLIASATANDTTLFTIAYGSDADEELLMELALEADGNFYLGDEANIAQIYSELSAAFGGSAGIGR